MEYMTVDTAWLLKDDRLPAAPYTSHATSTTALLEAEHRAMKYLEPSRYPQVSIHSILPAAQGDGIRAALFVTLIADDDGEDGTVSFLLEQGEDGRWRLYGALHPERDGRPKCPFDFTRYSDYAGMYIVHGRHIE